MKNDASPFMTLTFFKVCTGFILVISKGCRSGSDLSLAFQNMVGQSDFCLTKVTQIWQCKAVAHLSKNIDEKTIE